jgi:hypothetical protein
MYQRQYNQHQRSARSSLLNTRTINPSVYQGSTYNYYPHYRKQNTIASTIFLSFFMSLILSFVLSLANTIINIGLVPDLLLIWIRSFAIGFLISFPTALLAISAVRPIVNKMIPT